MTVCEFYNSTELGSLESEFGAHQLGRSLERHFYTEQKVYERDLEKIWGQSWIWVGHASQIPNSGDYFLFNFGHESVILVRDKENGIRAHLNVCRHRGSRVCSEQSGNTRSLVCPYHAWTYNLDGTLRGGRLMPEGFDRKDHGLMSVNLIEFQGLLFICLSKNPPPIEDALKQLAPMTKPFGFENMKIAHQQSYPVPANWKLAIENYLECYHCAPSHQEYSKSHSLKDEASMTPELMDAMNKRSLEVGLSVDELRSSGEEAGEVGTDVFYRRYPLYPGYLTGSKSGQGVAPLLGDLTGYVGGATDVSLGGLNFFLAYCDHVVGYRFIPTGLQTTDIQTVWMVRGDAEEGKDYNLDDLTWLWHVTTLDDERIIRHNQEGVNSFHYKPGPLSEMEWGIIHFHQTYFGMMG